MVLLGDLAFVILYCSAMVGWVVMLILTGMWYDERKKTKAMIAEIQKKDEEDALVKRVTDTVAYRYRLGSLEDRLVFLEDKAGVVYKGDEDHTWNMDMEARFS